ncbi:MDR family MFS transporter [Bacillus kwashiorkori]|uniref:MDR family MFS transporter n=1 Tax=Bacillus kwashiorkori TaxID=1522318 RepID=UPI00078473B1|nr:MFS transporter [Bacillus kwashiorkori]
MPRALWLIVIGMAVNVTGGSFLWPLNTIYLHGELGKSLTLAGFVLMLNSAASIIGNLYGGYLFDKIGGYRSVMLGIIITLASLIGLTFWHGWPHYPIFLTIIGFGSGLVNPAMYAFAGSVWKEGGRRAFNAMYVAANIGVAIGSALAGYVAHISFNLIFIANTSLYIVFFFIAFFGYRNLADNPIGPTVIQQQTPKKYEKNKKKLTALLILSIGYALCWLAYVQWQTTIATYTQELKITLEQYSLLWTVNGALIVLAQPLMSKFIQKFAKTLKIQIIIGLCIFIIAFSVASVSTVFLGFVTGMVIMTIGEMLVWPAIPTIADMLAPKGREGFYQGIVNSAATVGRMIGPILGGFLVDMYGMSVLFIILLSLFIVAIFTTIIYDRGLKATEKKSSSLSI